MDHLLNWHTKRALDLKCGTLKKWRGAGPRFFIPNQLKQMKFFKVTALIDGCLESCVLETDNKYSARKVVQQHWREAQIYNSKVVSIREATQKEWMDYAYNV